MFDLHLLKEEVKGYAKSIGIDKIRFTTAAPFEELKERLLEQQRLQYQSGFEEQDIEKRVNPSKLLEGAQSIIAIALAYPTKMTEKPKNTKGNRRGVFCRASWGIDYHLILKNRLEKLEQFLLEKVPEARCLSMVDTGALSDRAVAERAGIGFSGKNTSIITPEFGSYVYLGEMITTIPFAPDDPILDDCLDCTICIDACPTGAIVQPHQLDSNRCIAFLTQTKEMLPDRFRKHLGNRIYGCDTCQQVCPKNKGIDFHFHEEMEAEPEKVKPLLKPLLTMANREFKDTFGHMSGSWRGKKPIQRNAIMALAHYKDVSALPLLKELLLRDVRPVIRATAAWAIGEIQDDSMRTVLEEARKNEHEEIVQTEINNALKKLTT